MAAANAASARAGPWTVSAQFQLITVGIVPRPAAGAVAAPAQESPWVFIGASLNATISLLALTHLDPLTALFPAYILLLCGWLTVVIVTRTKMMNSH